MYQEIIKTIKPNQEKYSRSMIPIVILDGEMVEKLGDEKVFISEFVIAKILGYINHLKGHPEVTKEFFLELPHLLKKSHEVLFRGDRPNERYIICGDPKHRVVVEIKRDMIHTQINTIHLIKEKKLKRLRLKSSCM